MVKKNIILFLLAVALFSCGISKRKEAEKVITEFQEENVPDKRETVFEVSTTYRNGRVVILGETDNLQLKNKLLNRLNSIKIIDKIIILPDSTVGANKFGLINLSVANLRSKPNHSSELATQALMGTPVKILKNKNGWFRIQTPDNYISWVDASGIKPVSEDQLANWKTSKRIMYTGDNGAVFNSNRFTTPVTDLTMGNILVVLEQNSVAMKVELPDDRIGYSPTKNWVDFNEFKETVQTDTTLLAQMANQFMGRPYLWGGTSARAMDCSGFVKTLYFMNGIILARDASLQTKYGKEINTDTDFNRLQTGDLLFFGKKETPEQSERVTHVALSFGNTEYIHASGLIKSNSLDSESEIYSEHRKNSFIRARRVIGSENSEGIQLVRDHPWY